MGEKFVLPLGEVPIIGYNHHAFCLTILKNAHYYLPWLYSNYINLVFDPLPASRIPIDFYGLFLNGNPLIEKIAITHEKIRENNIDFNNYIIQKIREGYYPYIAFDEFYLPCRSAYQKSHFIHCSMLFGFDLAEKTFDIVGFNNNKMYKPSKITFEEAQEGCAHYPEFFCAKKDIRYCFDLKALYIKLKDLLESSNTVSIFTNEETSKIYGLAVYKRFKEMVYLYQKQDIRGPHILYEHKKLMCMRIKYLQLHNYINNIDEVFNGYKKLEGYFLNFRNSLLKEVVMGNTKLFDDKVDEISLKLNEIEMFEKGLLCLLIEKIENYNAPRCLWL